MFDAMSVCEFRSRLHIFDTVKTDDCACPQTTAHNSCRHLYHQFQIYSKLKSILISALPDGFSNSKAGLVELF